VNVHAHVDRGGKPFFVAYCGVKISVPAKLRDTELKDLEKLQRESKVSIPTMLGMAASLFVKKFKNQPDAIWEQYKAYRSESDRPAGNKKLPATNRRRPPGLTNSLALISFPA
jgi:hypothetical protein